MFTTNKKKETDLISLPFFNVKAQVAILKR